MSILNKLTNKHLKMNKKRTIVTIIGIILSTSLMVGIGLLLSTYREAMIEQVISGNGDFNVRINDLNNNNIDMLNNNVNIDKYITRSYVGYAITTYDTVNYYKIFSINEEYMKHLTLLEGRMPENSNEIIVPDYLVRYSNNGDDLSLGSIITLGVGERYSEGKKVDDITSTYHNEYINNPREITYKVVGIIKKDYYEDSEPGCFIYTYNDNSYLSKEAFITFKKVNKTFELSKSLTTSLGIVYEFSDYYNKVSYNERLLSLYGISKYSNMLSSLSGMLIIMLSLVSVACIIVIYNSFAISVMERKKQFGLMSSIGATKKQIRHTVLYEALIVSLIGIPLGILCSYIGIGIVVLVMDNLLKDILNMNFKLVTYPLFVIIPVIFMILTIFISAIIPAKKASKISPIEAIRLNDDIKIKGKKVRSPKIIKKLFGVEGDIAYKNMKRNKKKYRITVISLFISIVLFISSSAYINYILKGSVDYTAIPDLDINIVYSNNASKEVINSIINHDEVKEYAIISSRTFYTKTDVTNIYNEKYLEFLKDNNMLGELNEDNNISIVTLDNDSYNAYLKKIGKTEAKPILYNNYKDIIIKDNSRKSYSLSRYNNLVKDISIYDFEYNREIEEFEYKFISNIKDYYISEEKFIGIENFESDINLIVIISEDMLITYNLNDCFKDTYHDIYIKSPSYEKLDQMIKDYEKENKLDYINYVNIHEQLKSIYNLILVIKILVYGFIALVTLIGVTSVFNTINTSIALRRKEFAVLRSIGLTPKGFNKMLLFECLLFVIKSLFYAIPVSLGITYLIHLVMKNTVEIESILIPYKSILMASVGGLIIVAITMAYASKKNKKDNILEAIREENI